MLASQRALRPALEIGRKMFPLINPLPATFHRKPIETMDRVVG